MKSLSPLWKDTRIAQNLPSCLDMEKDRDVFAEKFSERILKRYLVYTKDLSREQDICCIPVYMTPFL